MKRDEHISKLQTLTDKYGNAQVAAWLGVKTTETLRTWKYRNAVSEQKKQALVKLYERKVKK